MFDHRRRRQVDLSLKPAWVLKKQNKLGSVVDAFNPSTHEAEASLVYRVSSRIARAVTQRNPVTTHTHTHTRTYIYIYTHTHMSIYALS